MSTPPPESGRTDGHEQPVSLDKDARSASEPDSTVLHPLPATAVQPIVKDSPADTPLTDDGAPAAYQPADYATPAAYEPPASSPPPAYEPPAYETPAAYQPPTYDAPPAYQPPAYGTPAAYQPPQQDGQPPQPDPAAGYQQAPQPRHDVPAAYQPPQAPPPAFAPAPGYAAQPPAAPLPVPMAPGGYGQPGYPVPYQQAPVIDPMTGLPYSTKSKVTAGLLQLLLSLFLSLAGVGRLYAGHTTIGLIQLGLFVLGWVGILFAWLVVPAFLVPLLFGGWIWGIVDGIILLASPAKDGRGLPMR